MRIPSDRPVPLYVIYFLLTLVMVAALLAWQAWKRSSDFRQFHQQLAVTSVSGTAEKIGLYFYELKRAVQLFADEHVTLFHAILTDPDSDTQWNELQRQVEKHFPEHFGITLTDRSGAPLRPDFDNLVGEICIQDIQTFLADHHTSQGVIHPNPLGYHFDMMVPWGSRNDPEGIFFLSFRNQHLVDILKRMQTPRHSLLLLNHDKPDLIEISALGSRDALDREFTLSPDEQQRIIYSVPVKGTGWDLVDITDDTLFSADTARNWVYAFGVFVVFVAVGVIMLRQIRRNERRRREAEEQAMQHQADLAHVDRVNTMGEMASGLAHELNQPLSAISTYSQAGLRLIRAPDAQPDKLVHALEQASIQAKRAGDIIHRMRHFVSKGTPRHEPLDLNSIVERATGFIQNDLKKKEIATQYSLGKNLPPVKGDNVQIEQVILNLFQNAVDAMKKAGSPVKRIMVSTRATRDGDVEFRIEDTGPGFDSQVLDKVFDTFFSTKEDGMGLGLSISQSIIEAHGGRLWCESAPGGGAVCRFTLPAYDEHENT